MHGHRPTHMHTHIHWIAEKVTVTSSAWRRMDGSGRGGGGISPIGLAFYENALKKLL